MSTRPPATFKLRALVIFNALDHFVFAIITLGYCRYYEIMSSAAYDLEQRGKWQGRLFRPMIDWGAKIIAGQTQHCKGSYEWQKELYKDEQ